MTYLIDTNVLSELRKPKDKADQNVARWFASVDAIEFFLSPITLMELELGILRIERRDPRQGNHLRAWFNNRVMNEFASRIIPIDARIALRCANLHVPDLCSEHDAWIAATALVHDMIVATRNVADFEPTGVRVLNPWQPQR